MACQAYRLLGDIPRALESYEKFLTRARAEGVNPEGVRQFEEVADRLRRSLTPTFIEASPPPRYTEASLQAALRDKLTEAQLVDVVNPLAGTEEMARWARDLTRGASSDLEKAKALFDGLTGRIDAETDRSTRTARQVFAVWQDPNESFNCQEYTKLFIVLARAVDLQAFYVHLDRDYAGKAVNHDCAIVFAGDGALLVDPAYRWFGVPHPDPAVLDDVQAIAHQHFQSSQLASCQLAARLHPDFAWGQRRLALSLLPAGRVAEARQAMDRAVELEPDHWETCRLRGIFALHDKDKDSAEDHLRKALAGHPHDADSHFLLAAALAQQDRLVEARRHARTSLRCRPEHENAESARRLIATINEQIGPDSEGE
jgi:Flp pilus assembly protein TadD